MKHNRIVKLLTVIVLLIFSCNALIACNIEDYFVFGGNNGSGTLNPDIESFEEFFEIFLHQLDDQIDFTVDFAQKQCEYSTQVNPSPIYSSTVPVCLEKGMDVQITCEDGLLDFVNDYDLCTLLGNLLDNGLEHAGFSQEAYLYLDIFGGQAGEVFLRMENSCEKQPVLLNGCLVTQKADRAQHGKGMVQIQRMTEQYGGQFSWTYDAAQKRFVTQCKFSMIS